METATASTINHSPGEIELPWRAFKAFVQLYDLDTGAPLISYRVFSHEHLLVFSNTRGGELVRKQLLERRLITMDSEGQRYTVLRGIPLGRNTDHDDPLDPVVRPQTRSTTGAAWIASQGRCSYCGTPLTFFSQLALSTVIDGGAPLFACKSCHAMRGSRSLDEFRFLAGMKEFERRNGVRFDQKQLFFLKQMGVELAVPDVEFWFERKQKGRAHLSLEEQARKENGEP